MKIDLKRIGLFFCLLGFTGIFVGLLISPVYAAFGMGMVIPSSVVIAWK